MSEIRVKTILVPTDFSEGSLAAMRYAAGLAELLDARLVFLHVVEPPAYGVELTGTHPGIAPNVTKKVAEMLHDWVAQVAARGARVEWHIELGSAFAEILAAASRYGADLIVMGTHGRTGLSHALLGSVAARVVQHAPCPVLTFRAGAAAPAAAIAAPAPRRERPVKCMICGAASEETICATCKARVQAEALARKQGAEKEGRSDDWKFAGPGEWR
ncbi:MAG: universal stress protein [Nitrospirota bacterium]